MSHHRRVLEGAAQSVFSSLLFSATAILVKLVGSGVNAYFISTIRFIAGIIITIIMVRLLKGSFRIVNRRNWIMRGVTGAISMITYYVAITYSGSGKATLLANTYPAFAALFAPLFGVKGRKSDWIAIVLCIGGTWMVFGGGGVDSVFGDMMAVTSSVLAGFSIHYIKRAAGSERPEIIYLSACLFGLIVAPLSFTGPVNLTLPAALLILAAALTAFTGQYTMNKSYAKLSAVKGSILSFIKIPMTIALSLLIGERFDLNFVFGSLLIGSGLMIATVPYLWKRMKEREPGIKKA